MTQHDHHCKLVMNGHAFHIRKATAHGLILIGECQCCGAVNLLDLTRVDFEQYCRAAVAVDYLNEGQTNASRER